jgi:tetratricopeptide (TPR) repeat protein
MLDTISDYAALINAAIGVAILGVLINLAKMHSEVLKERLEGAKDQSNWNRERFEAEKAVKDELGAENERLRVELEKALSERGVTLQAITTGADIIIEGKAEAAFVHDLASRLERQRADDPSPSPEIDLELAKAEMAQGNWEAASALLDRYVKIYPDSFDVQFARGVAWANTRSNNSAALRAYNEAIALLPPESNNAHQARVFTYRAAILKRLERLDEANADLMHALNLLQSTPDSPELDDLYYNLAAVAAMQGDKRNMVHYLMKIKDSAYAEAVGAHLGDYFKRFERDTDLKVWLESWR